jgi:hypothetical protein
VVATQRRPHSSSFPVSGGSDATTIGRPTVAPLALSTGSKSTLTAPGPRP